jgi:hypothetical protein
MASKKSIKQQARQALESLGPKVTLVGFVKYNGTWSRYPAAYNGSGQVLNNVVIINGQQVEFPVCKYELRYREDGIDKRPPVGKDAAAAEEERITVRKQLAAKRISEEAGLKTSQQAAGVVIPVDPVTATTEIAKRVTLEEVIAEYIEDCELQEHTETAKKAGLAWAEFVKANNIAYLERSQQKVHPAVCQEGSRVPSFRPHGCGEVREGDGNSEVRWIGSEEREVSVQTEVRVEASDRVHLRTAQAPFRRSGHVRAGGLPDASQTWPSRPGITSCRILGHLL